jgi:hypothetical protein
VSDVVPIYTRPFTVSEVAATAQLAGCLPEYMPVIVTALEILLEPRFDMFRVLREVDGSAPYFVLNGPVRKRLDVNGWRDTFGPWKGANATMGRAINLCLRTIGGLRYEIGLGTASQYTGGLFAENEEESPWRRCTPTTASGPRTARSWSWTAARPSTAATTRRSYPSGSWARWPTRSRRLTTWSSRRRTAAG